MEGPLHATRHDLFPPKAEKQQRQKGIRKPQIAFRVPEYLEAYIEAAVEGGYSQTEVVVRMLGVAKDAAEALGEEWFEIERAALGSGATPGTMLGRLARVGLLQERKSKK
jgi:hypothetical protein